MSRPHHTTPALALLSAACLLLVLLPKAAQAQSSMRTEYWINADDSTLIEIVLPDTAPTVPPDYPGDWDEITLDDIHDLGWNSPSENEDIANTQGQYWEIPSLGGGTVEWGWYVSGATTTYKYMITGAGSRRNWWQNWPGRVYAKTVMKKDGTPVSSAYVNKGFGWEAKAQTLPYRFDKGEYHAWVDSTEHWYGASWIYHKWPGVVW